MKKPIYLLLIVALLIALILRLYPTLISQMPFSTDAWPLIRDTNILMQNTPLALNSNLFDDYNNFWPASIFFSAILSEITSLPPITSMALGIPIISALTIPLFYLLAKKITQNSKISLIATILLATAFPYTVMAAGVTKETFTMPICILVILLFLQKHNWKTIILFSIASIALILAHHLTDFLTIGILVSITIALHISLPNKKQKTNSTKSNILLTTILSTMTALYFGLYAYPALTSYQALTITPSDLLSVGAYQIIVIAAAVFFTHIAYKESKMTTALKCSIIFLLVTIFFLIATRIPIMPMAPTVPLRYIVYVMPLIVALPLTVYALSKLYQKKSRLIIPLFWLIPATAFAAYGIFANSSMGLTFAYRSLNFILPPLAILMAIGIYKLYSNPIHFNMHKISKIIAVTTILFIVALNVYSLYATVSLQEPYLGYFWRYQPTEYYASNWITVNGNNQTIAGDSKVSYLLNGYFNQNVSIAQGFDYLAGTGSAPQILYIYNELYTNGYVLYEGNSVTLPANWTEKLSDYNMIYANSEVTIYAKR